MAFTVNSRLCVLILAFLVSGEVAASAWQGDQSAGSLQFIAVQAGAKFTGSFRTFSVRLDFDPAKPATGSLDATVALVSTDTADAERDDVLKGADFFWTDRYPQAKFHATKFRKEGARWRADGELTLRDVTRPVSVLFALDHGPKELSMQGGATLKRLAFGVGQGEWDTTEWVGDEVEVRFDLKLKAAAAAASP